MQMLITEVQAKALRDNRVNSTKRDGAKRYYNSTGKRIKRGIYADIRRAHGIATGTKIVFFIDNESNPLYRVIRDKRTKLPLDDGKVAPVAAPALPSPVVDVVAKPVKATKAPAAKKAVAAKAPAKKAPAKKAVAAKAPAKAVKAAPVKATAKKAPAKAPAKAVASPAKAVKAVVAKKAPAAKKAAPAVKKPAAKKAKA
jgi:hypothetical protein